MKSVRFPRKPLAKIGQLPMIHHVYNRAVEAELNIPIYVATDSTDILDYCNSQNIQTVHTGNHSTGTDRVFEAAQKIGFEYAINLQGDEPLMPSSALQAIFTLLSQSPSDSNNIFTSICQAPCDSNNDPNIVKAIVTRNYRALYFTRHSVPTHGDASSSFVYKQMGIYGYSINTLKYFTSLAPSKLESREKIELMRHSSTAILLFVISQRFLPIQSIL